MAETVSGNENPIETEPLEPIDVLDPVEPVQFMEPAVTNYEYETDNSTVCRLLESLLSEAVKNNDVLERLADSLDSIKETLTAEPEETVSEDAVSDESDETESSREELTEMLESMEETIVSLKETGESINETVSGNTLYLEDISAITQTLEESYTEASENQTFTNTYGLALGMCILFVAACIAGLHIAKMVWGKTR